MYVFYLIYLYSSLDETEFFKKNLKWAFITEIGGYVEQ